MDWQVAGPSDLKDLTAFLKTGEWSHVAFSSRLLKSGRSFFPTSGEARIFINRDSQNRHKIGEAMYFSHGGTLVPVLKSNTTSWSVRNDIAALLSGRSRGIFSIMGTDSHVRSVELALGLRPTAWVDYNMLVHDWKDIPENTNEAKPSPDIRKLRFRRAGPGDLQQLFPLHMEYEKEEVLIDPSRFNRRLSYRALQKSLSEQIVFYAVLGRRVVAKAGTNAVGLSYAQVGGVFTVPELRNRGIAAELMKVLVHELAAHEKSLCLFVKKSNPAAGSLYAKLGFRFGDDFRIAYFRGVS